MVKERGAARSRLKEPDTEGVKRVNDGLEQEVKGDAQIERCKRKEGKRKVEREAQGEREGNR